MHIPEDQHCFCSNYKETTLDLIDISFDVQEGERERITRARAYFAAALFFFFIHSTKSSNSPGHAPLSLS